MKVHWIKIFVITGLIALSSTVSRAADGSGTAGLEPIFSLGAGARQLGLGGACIAVPLDATTIYWNPAAIDFIEKRSVSFFHTNLLGGANYNYLGYVNPTTSIGTFGIGALHWGVDGLKYRSESSPLELGEFEALNYQFMISYGKMMFSEHNLSFGVNIKMSHQSFPGAPQKASDTGVGADFALYYQPDLYGSLNGMSFGFVVQNILSPRLKPGEDADVIPKQIKLGMAKTFNISAQGNSVMLLLDLVKSTAPDVPFGFRVGAEYTYNRLAMFRLGMNNQQETMNFMFGGGISYNIFQIDYSYASLLADFSPSHRFSISASFGQTKSEKIAAARELELQRIREEVANQQRMLREQTIREHLEQGRKFLDKGEFIDAQLEFKAVLQLDSDNSEANEKYGIAKTKYDEEQEREREQRLEREKIEEKQAAKEQYIETHWETGLAYYQRKQYEEAMKEWNLVLDREPNHQMALEFRNRALTDLRDEVKNLIRQADAHASNQRFMDAVRLLDRARQRNIEEMRLDDEIESKLKRYERAMNSEQRYTKGLNYYENKEYEKAVEMFEKALESDPNNKTIKELLQQAQARATAKNMPLPPELKPKYFQGVNLLNNGRYEEALNIFKEILRVQPNNKRVLTSYDQTREKLENSKRQNGGRKN